MLVDWMCGLSGSGIIEHDLEDHVNPCAVGCTNDQRRVVSVGVGFRVGVEEERCLVICLGIIKIAATEGPIVIRAEATEFEDVSRIGGRGGFVGRVRNQESFVEGNDGGRSISASIVDVCGRINRAIGGCGVVTVMTFVRRVISVGELRVTREYLVCTRVCDADSVISWSLIKLDHCGEALAIVQEDCVG